MGEASQVFISYGHREQGWVRQFVEKLANEGIRVWTAEKEISTGEPVAEKLEEALRSSDSLVLVLDVESVRSPNVLFELGAALGMGKQVIAIVGKDVQIKDLPIKLEKYFPMESPQETARDVAKVLTASR